MLFVLVMSLSDGYKAKKNTSIKLCKYILLTAGILYFALQWFTLYFDWDTTIENIDKKFTLDMLIFDYNLNDSFSYKAIALSSYSKLVCFLCIQLYRHIKHPNRINTIPIFVKIKQCDFIDHEEIMISLNIVADRTIAIATACT